MSDVERMVARLVAESGVRRTIADYCQCCDDGRFDEYAACFAPDAVVALQGKEIAGRAAIREWIMAGQPPEKRGKHVTINVLVDIDDDASRATASTDYLFVAKRDGKTLVTTAGRYLDVLVPLDGRWLFARREITFLGGAL